MRIAAILGLLTLGACGLYFTHDGTERQGGTVPDAGTIGHGDCGGGGGYPDAGVEDGGGYLPDGGWGPLPDAGWSYDGGGYGPDAGWSYDGGGYLPDAWIEPSPDAH